MLGRRCNVPWGTPEPLPHGDVFRNSRTIFQLCGSPESGFHLAPLVLCPGALFFTPKHLAAHGRRERVVAGISHPARRPEGCAFSLVPSLGMSALFG